MKRKKFVVRAQGYTFVFFYDRVAPNYLHIFARHLAEPADAIETFFEPNAKTIWNEERRKI